MTVAGAARGQLAAGDSFGELGIFSGPARGHRDRPGAPPGRQGSREALLEAFHGDQVTQRPLHEVIEGYQRQADSEDG